MNAVDVSWPALTPLLLLSGASVLVLLVDLFSAGRNPRRLGWLCLLGLGATAFAAASMWNHELATLGGTLVVDRFGVFFTVLLCGATALTVLMSMSYLEQTEIRTGDYYTLLMFAAVGMVLMATAGDLMVLFIGLEVMSIAAYALAGMQRSRTQSNEAALKYFLLGAFASGFLLFGIALLFGATGATTLGEIASRLEGRTFAADPLWVAGTALLLVGFAFKVALVPFHAWTPDVYEGAPTSVTAFMAVGVKAAAFAAFARMFLGTFADSAESWNALLWALAVLTMTVGNVIAVVQTNVKRMLAYSSIAHAGYLLVGFVVGGEAGGSAMLFYLIAYSLMTLGAFAVMIAVGRAEGPLETFDDYAGIALRSPLLGMAMAVFMLSLAGVPPLGGFFGKFYLFRAAIDAGYIGLTILGVLNSAISVYYYVALIVRMYMMEGDVTPTPLRLRPHVALAVLITLGATIAIGIVPSTLLGVASTSFAGQF